MAGESDKTKTASSAKLVSAPLGKYFKMKIHADLVVKPIETTGNRIDIGGTVDPNANILTGDCVIEQDDGEMHKESLQAVNCDISPTPARINVPMEEVVKAVYEEGRKSGPSNNAVPRDTLAQAEAQALTQALVHDLSPVNMGEKAQKGEQILGKRGLTSKIGQDLELGDRFFSLSDQSSWTSNEAIESREGSSRAWRTSWSEAGFETTTPGEDEDEKSEWGKGSGQPESFKAATVKKKDEEENFLFTLTCQSNHPQSI
ncbi:hypothetical protein NDU88_008302 [Pleurodeles waltl]|uniref:Uncharacterized protein n=1 Tax=Pleurodeles waltl TaxID=8319 RepID=A0AAV7RUX4_PLEWA|nr:hypothetical protein NDU88_008301 [Pleurodeles waltl]KAJ1155573.1 hypothetical protein NDU88_008302 [Pleurodeles waltl]